MSTTLLLLAVWGSGETFDECEEERAGHDRERPSMLSV